MLLISHRGNCDGLNPKQENTPDYIDAAINRGYDVEVDIWFLDDKFWLGHDRGDHEIAKEWLLDRKDKLWIHCKNFQALSSLIDSDLRIFYHEREQHTIMSNGLIWSHNISEANEKCIIPLLTKDSIMSFTGSSVYGICSDYVIQLEKVI